VDCRHGQSVAVSHLPGRWQRLARGELAPCDWLADGHSHLDPLRFDGDPVQFRLGVEARRINIAFAYEMAGVAVSNIQPAH
jgi:hypothetical protein